MNIELKDDEILIHIIPHEPLGDGCLVAHENGMPCGHCKKCKEWVEWDQWESGCASLASSNGEQPAFNRKDPG